MGSCASASQVVSRNEQQVKKVKIPIVRLKQREETRRLRAAGGMRLMIGEDRNAEIELDQFAKQVHLMPRTHRNVSTFFGTLGISESQKTFQPMLKNMVLDNQESFPQWLEIDEQFRNDQMQDFLSKCQETAKLQSQDENDVSPDTRRNTQHYNENSRSHFNNGENSDDDNNDDEDDDDQSSVTGKFKKSNAGGMLTSIARSTAAQQQKNAKKSPRHANGDDDPSHQIASENEDENEALISKNVSQNRLTSKSPNHGRPPRSSAAPKQHGATTEQRKEMFTKTRSIYEEKSQISRPSAVDDDDESNSDDSNEEENRKDMHKFQELSELSGLRLPKNLGGGSQIHNGKGNSHSRIESMDQASESDATPAGGIRAKGNSNHNNSRSQAASSALIKSDANRRMQPRMSNGSNHYVIKEFVIVRNTWIHTAICQAAIKTPTSLLEFKRRYFYEFDKMSAFLSQLLALKRMNFPNLLTFSYVQIGEAQYTGDLKQLKRRIEQEKIAKANAELQLHSPTLNANQNTLGIKDPTPQRNKRRGSTLHFGGQLSQDPLSGEASMNEIEEEEDSRLIMYIDRIFPECGKSLDEFIASQPSNMIEDTLRICSQGFKVFYSIANTLCKMHRAGFSYRVLRPSMVRIVQQGKEMNVFLDSPDFIWDTHEISYLTKAVKSEMDFVNYDCKCLAAIMIYYFLMIQETRVNAIANRRRGSDNRIGSYINNSINPNGTINNLNQQPSLLYDTHLKPGYVGVASSVTSLKLISVAQPHAMSFAEIVAIEDQIEMDSLVDRLKLPQIVIETIKELIVPDLKAQKPIEEFAVRLLGVLEKGPQTAFKHDSLSAYLSFHGQRTLKNENMHVYFRRKNQVHFYEFESKTFKVIKLIRKKAKFPVRTHMTFSLYDNCFYFFAAPNSNKIVKFPLDTNSKQRHVINQKSEVLFYKSIKMIMLEDPQILTVIPNDLQFQLYVFNSKKNTDNDTNDVYYNSFIISKEYKESEKNKGDWKENIQIYEGPRNYLWRRRSFHFYDPHNKFIYCILDSNNIFERGIRYSYFDTSVEKGDFKDGNLRFACSTEEVYSQFCALNMDIQQMEFCVEVQHGVFLLQASKNIYILDFNYKCFYSFSTLKQLQEYEANTVKHPHRHAYAYEVLNQPFEIKLNTQLNLGKNVVFQEGMLHILGRKEIETVICTYELLPTQGVMVLKKCISLHSFDDILLKIPRHLSDIWNFQEFKRVVLERPAAPHIYIERHQPNYMNQLTNHDTLNHTNTATTPTAHQQSMRSVPTIKVSGAGADQLYTTGSMIFNTQNLKPSVTTIPAADSSGTAKFKKAATKGVDNESEAAMSASESQRSGALNKQDEQRMQLFTTKINILNGSPSNLTGAKEDLDDLNEYHENQFKLLSIFQKTKEYTLYRILHHSIPCNLRKAGINSIAQYEQYIQLLEMNAQSKYLMQIKQCFLTQDDDTGMLNINLIEDDCEWSLLDELRRRKQDTNYFRSAEVGQLLKAIFRAVLALQSIELVHGNVKPELVYFTSRGCIRLAGWYLDNQEQFENDFFDACSLVYQIATLEFEDTKEPFKLTLPLLQSRQETLKVYPGLYSFLHNNLLVLQDGENLDLEKVDEDIRSVYQSLQVSMLKQNRVMLSSVNQHVFWVEYGSNYIISTHNKELTFCKNEVIFHNNLPYKFSKYNMFTFDSERTMYMSGAIKEDFKSPTQMFYSMDFSFIHNAKVKLHQLKDIPNTILQPSLMYCNEYVYCVGGYQIKFDGSKSISKKAYRYSRKTEDWEQLSDMPVGVVNGTLLTGKDNKVLYLFGGVSEEVNLRGRELNYIMYDIDFDEWSLKVDLSMKSPFVNNRYVKPLIDHIGNNIFVSMQRNQDAIFIQFFELSRGGLNIKFKIDEEKDELIKEQNEEIDVFNEVKYSDYFKMYQDDLSMIFVNDTVFIIDEFSNALLTINFANFNNIKYERTPCSLIQVQRHAQIDKQQSYEHDTSVDSFQFNGY